MRRYLVGGAVRDCLLGRVPADRDWLVTQVDGAALLAAGFRPVGKGFTAFLHPQSNDEYALPRGPIDKHDELATITADLARRDITINSMAQADDGALIDPFDGQRDLATSVIRHTSHFFREDPLRVLRSVRLSAKLDFSIAPSTQALCLELCTNGALSNLPGERIAKEVLRALDNASPRRFIASLQQTGVIDALMPELKWLYTPHAQTHKSTRMSVSKPLVSSLDSLIEVLENALTTELSEAQRYAVFAQACRTSNDNKALAKRLGVPNTHARTAQLLMVTNTALRHGTAAEPKALFNALSRLGIYGSHNQLDEILECIECCVGGDQKAQSNWRTFALRAAHVSTQIQAQHVVNSSAQSDGGQIEHASGNLAGAGAASPRVDHAKHGATDIIDPRQTASTPAFEAPIAAEIKTLFADASANQPATHQTAAPLAGRALGEALVAARVTAIAELMPT